MDNSEIFFQLKDGMPDDKLPAVNNKIKTLTDKQKDRVITMSYHNPILILILSIFLGGLGIDRFMIGDIGLGVAKLLVGWLTLGIWPLIDIFLCYKDAKEKNYEKFLLAIDFD